MSATSTNKVAIVIPNWNGADSLEACIRSLQDQSQSADIIIVDNGSTDSSLTLLEQSFPDITVLSQSYNLGFAGGVNVGIRSAIDTHNYIALFNNDAVADSNWLKSLLETMTVNSDAAVATCLLLSSDGSQIDSTGEQYSIWGLPFPRQRGHNVAHASEKGKTFGASGGASLYRSSALKEVGLFDETFFAYYEDTDISFRFQLSGYGVYFNPTALAYHEQGATSRKIPGFTVFQTFKNLPLLYHKNVPRGLRHVIGPRFYLAYTLMLLNAIKNGNGGPALKGLFQSIRLTPQALRERKQIQSHKTVSNDYIKSILWPDLPPDQTGLRKFRKFFTGKD